MARDRGRVAKTPRPRKKPANARKAAARKAKRPGPKRRPDAAPPLDPSAADDAETRFVQPYDAVKTYRCPGCNRDIPPGLGHIVAVPPGEPDLRRHWHRGCWLARHERR